VFDEEDGDAVVGSPRGKQHISPVKCRLHHNSSRSDQTDAELQIIVLKAAGNGTAVSTPNQVDKVAQTSPSNS
jgi:hypothetical protein